MRKIVNLFVLFLIGLPVALAHPFSKGFLELKRSDQSIESQFSQKNNTKNSNSPFIGTWQGQCEGDEDDDKITLIIKKDAHFNLFLDDLVFEDGLSKKMTIEDEDQEKEIVETHLIFDEAAQQFDLEIKLNYTLWGSVFNGTIQAKLKFENDGLVLEGQYALTIDGHEEEHQEIHCQFQKIQ